MSEHTRRGSPPGPACRSVSDDESFAGLGFKIATDPFVGKLTYLRVYSGVLKSGSYIYNSTRDKRGGQ